MLDYGECASLGEPRVVHVDQERDYAITPLAQDFKTFVRGLVDESVFAEDEDERKEVDRAKVRDGKLSPLLARLCANADEVDDVEKAIRALAEKVVDKKGFFALHADRLSHSVYDAQLWLYAKSNPVFTRERFLADYKRILALEGEFSTGGYAPVFVSDWLDERMNDGTIVRKKGGLALAPTAALRIARKLAGAVPGA